MYFFNSVIVTPDYRAELLQCKHLNNAKNGQECFGLSIFFLSMFNFFTHCPAGNYMFKVNKRNTRTRCETCLKLTIKTPEQRHGRCLDFTTASFVMSLDLHKRRITFALAFPVGDYLFKVGNVNTKTCSICPKLTIKTPERRRLSSAVFIVNFKQISYIVMVFPL